jgi:hypothetical protein
MDRHEPEQLAWLSCRHTHFVAADPQGWGSEQVDEEVVGAEQSSGHIGSGGRGQRRE